MKCLECGHDLTEMRRDIIHCARDSLDAIRTDLYYQNWSYSKSECAGHCTNCFRDWEWTESFDCGEFIVTQPTQIFWG